jgi:hypothetical protein
MTAKREKAAFTDARQQVEASKTNRDIPVIKSWRKVNGDKKVWFVTIEGSDREMRIDDIRDITNYEKFSDQCVMQLNRMFSETLKRGDWKVEIKEALRLLIEEQAAEDTTQRGQFTELLETYLTNRQRGQKKEDLLLGRPWEDEEEGRHYFKMTPLMKFLEREGMRNLSRHDCIMWINKLGGGEQPTSIKGKSVRLRWVPSGALQQTPEVAPPKMPPAVV